MSIARLYRRHVKNELKNYVQQQPHAKALTASCYCIRLRSDQEKHWVTHEGGIETHLFVSYFMGLTEFSQSLSSKQKGTVKG